MASATNTINILLGISGSINPTFARSFATASASIRSLQRQAMATSSMLGRFGRGLFGLGALGGGVAAFAGLNDFLSKGVKLAREQVLINMDLKVLLENNLKMRHQDVGLAGEQLRAIQAQAHALQEQTGINENIFVKGAAILATAHRTTDQIKMMQPLLANIMIHQKAMGASTESLAVIYESLAKSLTGMGRGLSRAGVLLTPIQRELMTIFAKMGAVPASIALTQKALALFDRETKEYAKTIVGATAIAEVHIQSWQKTIGKLWLPIIQQSTILFGKILDLFGPYMVTIIETLTKHVGLLNKEWDRHYAAIKKVVEQGWQKLIGAIAWFRNNSSWLLPWIERVIKAIGLWVFAIEPLIHVIVVLRSVLVALAFSNPFTLLAVAAGAAAYYVITHWNQVKKWFMQFWEWMAGTKTFNADLEPAGVMRAYKPGQTPKAQPVQQGLFNNFLTGWKKFFEPFQKDIQDIKENFGAVISGIESNWNKMIQGIDIRLWTDLRNIFAGIANLLAVSIHNEFEFMIKSVDILSKAVRGLGDLWNTVNEWLDKINAHRWIPGSGDPRPPVGVSHKNDWMKFGSEGSFGGTVWSPIQLARRMKEGEYTGDIRAMTYGPQSEGATSADMRQIWGATVRGQKIRLGPESAAISPNLLPQYPLQSWVDEIDAKTGKVVRHRRIDDTSWIRPGVPTRNAIENYNDVNLGHVKLRRSPIQGPSSAEDLNKTSSTAPITIHNNVTYHVHGEDHARQIAELHRKHIENLRNDLAEANWRNSRQSFANT